MSENRNTQNILFFCFECKHSWEEEVPYVGFKRPKETEDRVCVKCGSKGLRISLGKVTMYPRVDLEFEAGQEAAEILREAGMDEPMEHVGLGDLENGKIALADIQRLDIEPGEFLVVKVPKDTPAHTVAHAASQFARLLKGVRVMIVPRDWEMKVIATPSIEDHEHKGTDANALITEPPALPISKADIQSASERAMESFQKHVAKR